MTGRNVWKEPTVTEIVQSTIAIRWWIDRQIEQGKTDDEIATLLPVAVEVISGRLDLSVVADRLVKEREEEVT